VPDLHRHLPGLRLRADRTPLVVAGAKRGELRPDGRELGVTPNEAVTALRLALSGK
jgi:hypothetical protein